MRKPYRYNNVAAKFFFVKRQEARAWRAKIRSGVATPPPPGNPYITEHDLELYRRLRERKH